MTFRNIYGIIHIDKINRRMVSKITMNIVRQKIVEEVASAKCKDDVDGNDLIRFCVCSEYFEYSADKLEESDFNELAVIVEKDWLFALIKRIEKVKTDDEVQKFLKGKYTSDDSSTWYEEAILANKIVMIGFN